MHDYTKNPDWMKNLMSNNAPETFNEKLLLIENTLNNKGNFTYSNTNYLFLEKIVESVTKKPFQEVFNKFYSKIDLPNIKIGVNEEGLEAYFGQTEKGSSKVSAWREYYGFDGGVYTNSKTLDTFLTKLYKDISILKPSTIAQMETWTKMEPMTIPIGSGVIYKYGYGVMKLTYNDQEYVGHPGGTLKYQSFVFYNAKKDISISVVSNCSGRYFNNIFFQELIPAILDEL